MKVKRLVRKKKSTIAFLGLVVLVVIIGLIIITVNRSEKEKRLKKVGDQTEEVSSGISQTIPKNFPSDFPIYPGAKVENSYVSKGEEVEAQSVVWNVEATLSEVSEFFKLQLPNKGWKIGSVVEGDDSMIVSFSKNEVEGFLAVGKGTEAKVVISVTIGAKFEEPSI